MKAVVEQPTLRTSRNRLDWKSRDTLVGYIKDNPRASATAILDAMKDRIGFANGNPLNLKTVEAYIEDVSAVEPDKSNGNIEGAIRVILDTSLAWEQKRVTILSLLK